MRDRRSAALGLVLCLLAVFSAQDAARAANIRNHIEAVRRDAAVVYLGVVGVVELSERQPGGHLEARAGVNVLSVARSAADETPSTVTLEYPTWDDEHPPSAGDGQYRLETGSLVVVFADSWSGGRIEYLLKGERDELLRDLRSRGAQLAEMSAEELELHEIDEDDRRAQLELYRLLASQLAGASGRFDTSRDLLLAQFDCKTDVDDLHSVAAVATILRDERFAGVDYHAVAGAYGRQGGLYVPAPALFELAFGRHWSDAHNEYDQALMSVVERVVAVLRAGGRVWVAEAGQSDFTADWLARVMSELPEVDPRQHVHVVQHSEWNESSATPEKLSFVKSHSTYHKIPDGNATGNGTPGFRSESASHWRRATGERESAELWKMARRIGEEFNGSDGRYDNAAVASGGIDFSDAAETCWIFGFEELFDVESFFDTFSR